MIDFRVDFPPEPQLKVFLHVVKFNVLEILRVPPPEHRTALPPRIRLRPRLLQLVVMQACRHIPEREGGEGGREGERGGEKEEGRERERGGERGGEREEGRRRARGGERE